MYYKVFIYIVYFKWNVETSLSNLQSGVEHVLFDHPLFSCALINLFLNLQQIVAAINAGIIPLGNTSNQISHWDLGSSFFFAGTVITTIGRRPLTLFFYFGTICELKFIYLHFFSVGQNGQIKIEK